MEQKIKRLMQNWQKRNIQSLFCENKQEAAERILEIVPLTDSIGFSGSQTLEQLEVIKKLQARGNQVFNPYKTGISREESLELRKQGSGADYYLASANAVSEKGELVFFSAYGNRTAGISSARNVLIVCGINKITANLEAALKRAREYATPLNCRRLNWKAACFEDGLCRQESCLFPEYKRMCCQVLIIEAEIAAGRLKVILVGESLGF